MAISGVVLAGGWLALRGCTNNPYRPGETAEATLFMSMPVPPNQLDVGSCYYSHEATIVNSLCEAPLDYHFLKRPFQLVPRTVEALPVPSYFDAEGRPLEADAPASAVARAEYLVRVRPGIFYADHPCFARDAEGRPLYFNVKDEDLRGIETPYDFPVRGTRELTAEDYVRGIRRLADPRVACPILSTIERYLTGLGAFRETIADALAAERARREAEAAAGRPRPEKEEPIVLDYLAYPCPAVEPVDRYTFKLVLDRKYPQMRYWLAMHFFSPVPAEALLFYAQKPMVDRQFDLRHWPVGTGAFYMSDFDASRRIVLRRNPRYRGDVYPSEGEPSDAAAGWLRDAGRPTPFVDRVVITVERETIPLWNKFLQGYLDLSIITPEAFDQTIALSVQGDIGLSPAMQERGIQMYAAADPSFYALGFNMADDVVGGYTPERAKLRQAVTIALDYNEYLDIFYNGRGRAAQGPLPPGIFGYLEGEAGVNPYIDQWDPVRQRAMRRPIEAARQLMAEAGYPQGRGPSGRPLTLYLDHSMGGAPAFVSEYEWMRQRLSLIGVDLRERGTELKRFVEKVDAGNVQLFMYGWNADYPDPENFLFLYYGPNAKIVSKGENRGNYRNEEFDRLFERMESMEDGPARAEVLARMVDLLRRDNPCTWGYNPLRYTLAHAWYGNGKLHAMGNNNLRFIRIDGPARAARQAAWNPPRRTPVLAALALLLVALIPAWRSYRRQERGGAPC